MSSFRHLSVIVPICHLNTESARAALSRIDHRIRASGPWPGERPLPRLPLVRRPVTVANRQYRKENPVSLSVASASNVDTPPREPRPVRASTARAGLGAGFARA
jgi:hypothetical protein